MLMRTDPFRDLDRLTQQVFGTPARPAAMPIDAYRLGDTFVVEFDLPGVSPDSIDLTVERNVLSVHATRTRVSGRADGDDGGRTTVSAPSAASCSWARPSIATGSPPTTATACSAWRYRWPSRPNPRRWPSSPTIVSRRPSPSEPASTDTGCACDFP